MRIVKQSQRARPRVSLILLDWSVRESFHLLHYLGRQDVERDQFEVIVIEYHSRISDAIRPFEEQVDSWLLLEMPEECYYHKHLMYNAGIVAAKGEICVICDSDAMVKPGFIGSIVVAFENRSGIVLHIDQFRNSRKDFYPFSYPNFSEVIGRGCVNNVGGKTRGIVDDKDPIHNRNYGACMCARREDLLRIGGADEHIDFLGHICGPYDMTFRLVNMGHREIWHQTEFMYHTWHPGQAGEDNYLGPHDGRHVSTTALDALLSGRIMPLEENESIRHHRSAELAKPGIGEFMIDRAHFIAWQRSQLRKDQKWVPGSSSRKIWFGFVVDQTTTGLVAHPRFLEHPEFSTMQCKLQVHARTEADLNGQLNKLIPLRLRMIFPLVTFSTYLSKAIGLVAVYLQRRLSRLANQG